MAEVCRLSGKFNGYQLEKLFEPNSIKKVDGVFKRSCKWDRYIKGVTPNKNALKLVYDKFPHAIELYDSLLWESLQVGPLPEFYWEQFYLKLPINLKRLANRFRSYKSESFYKLGKNKQHALNEIRRVGNLDALACMFALMRECSANGDYGTYDFIETAIFNLIFWTLSKEPFFRCRSKIFVFLVTHIFIGDEAKRLRDTPWNLTLEQINGFIYINQKNILLAEDLQLVIGDDELYEFIYWKSVGDSKLIVKEMAQAFRCELWEVKDSQMGLKWLIKQLNKTRKSDRKIGGVI
ncbi:hypothetical protein [Pseudoalteromonas maricaloris]|uniref:hypothetical protein n=1 Tax=Pseudoalteromonas maricaloris TaxID=184924 RepID=UPI00166076FF|nr:hypothetical protein [Pseudoalteromonas flavipulchra]MBD0781814.1 hypothetical protein [Pseudoalteromonas flavipulchra]